MTNEKNSRNYLHGFWPMFAIGIFAAVVAFIIYAFASGNIVRDEIDSTTFMPRFHAQKTFKNLLQKKDPIKKPVTKPITKTTAQ